MALDGIDISVRPGELFGLLGPNGAGKTTTVKVLLGLTAATSGSARISGLPVSNPESRRSVGYLPEGHKIPGYLTARQALSIFGRMSGMEKRDIASRTGVNGRASQHPARESSQRPIGKFEVPPPAT